VLVEEFTCPAADQLLYPGMCEPYLSLGLGLDVRRLRGTIDRSRGADGEALDALGELMDIFHSIRSCVTVGDLIDIFHCFVGSVAVQGESCL